MKNEQPVPEASAALVKQIQAANPEALKTLSDMNAKAADMVIQRVSKKADPNGNTPKGQRSKVPTNNELSNAQQSSSLGSGSHAMVSFNIPNDSKNPSNGNKHERGVVTNKEESGPFNTDVANNGHSDATRSKAYMKYSQCAPGKLAQNKPKNFPRELHKYFEMDGDQFKLTEIGSPSINHKQFKLDRDGDPSKRLVLNPACDPNCWWFIFFCRKNSRANYFKSNICFIEYELASNTELKEDDQMLISHTSNEWMALAAVYKNNKKDKKGDKKEDRKGDKKGDKRITKRTAISAIVRPLTRQ
jgi:hypothetical protein